MAEPNSINSVCAKLVDKREAAEMLGVCVRTVENLMAQGKLSFVKINAAVRFDPADIRNFIENSKS